MSNHTPIQSLKEQLKKIPAKKFRYRVPSLWVPFGKEPIDGKPPVCVDPAEFFLSHLEALEKHQLEGIDAEKSLNHQLNNGNDGGEWIAEQSIYNIFVRLTAAYDHDGDGQLGGSKADLTLNSEGVRESGTFLKCIAMLGYIKALGCTAIHLLPVTAIGHDGNKGDLGSPYAIKNPYRLEETLADPLIDMTVEDQFRAFVQAAHMVGIRVIAEFVFRTASKDSDWIAENPDWFYWIDENIKDRDPGESNAEKIAAGYGNPVFSKDELEVINRKVAAHDFNDLPAPPEYYRNFFKLPPEKESVALNRKGEYRGEGRCPISGTNVKVRIPGAFADWPPDDNQPPWGDVTYLRMYNDENPQNPEFNYIAYNTIRMYDTRLARADLANRGLWQTIEELIPTYQREYGIDGVMVDMGHAVPVTLMQNIISTARRHDPNFAFLSENFEIKEDSVQAGYNAVVGYAWWVEYRREGMYDLLDHVGTRGVPLSFFGAVENHNTPRAAGRNGGEKYARYAFLVNTMLPHAIPFVHSGQELGETMPVNTGLDFTNQDLERLKGRKLALFDLCGYSWDGGHDMFAFIRRVLALRREYNEVFAQKSSESFAKVLTGQADVISFIRRGNGINLAVLFNRDLENGLKGELELEWAIPAGVRRVENLLAESAEDSEFAVINQRVPYELKPGECRLLKW